MINKLLVALTGAGSLGKTDTATLNTLPKLDPTTDKIEVIDSTATTDAFGDDVYVMDTMSSTDTTDISDEVEAARVVDDIGGGIGLGASTYSGRPNDYGFSVKADKYDFLNFKRAEADFSLGQDGFQVESIRAGMAGHVYSYLMLGGGYSYLGEGVHALHAGAGAGESIPYVGAGYVFGADKSGFLFTMHYGKTGIADGRVKIDFDLEAAIIEDQILESTYYDVILGFGLDYALGQNKNVSLFTDVQLDLDSSSNNQSALHVGLKYTFPADQYHN